MSKKTIRKITIGIICVALLGVTVSAVVTEGAYVAVITIPAIALLITGDPEENL